MKLKDKILNALRAAPDREYTDVAREFGCTAQYVSYVALNANMRKRNTRAMLTYEQKARVEYMLQSGDYSYAEIARQIGCDDQTITRFAVKRGIYRPPAYNPPSVLRKAVALVRAGKSFSQAAAYVGATRNAVAGAVWRARTQVSA